MKPRLPIGIVYALAAALFGRAALPVQRQFAEGAADRGEVPRDRREGVPGGGEQITVRTERQPADLPRSGPQRGEALERLAVLQDHDALVRAGREGAAVRSERH